MKFPTLALIACSFLLESTTAYQPLRASAKTRELRERSPDEELERCFERCGDGKDVDDEDKIVECQVECVDDQLATGRSRRNIGPRGEYNF